MWEYITAICPIKILFYEADIITSYILKNY